MPHVLHFRLAMWKKIECNGKIDFPKEPVELMRDSGKPKPKDEFATECKRIASAPPGNRNDVLNRAAKCSSDRTTLESKHE
jgi:hypothetical protein